MRPLASAIGITFVLFFGWHSIRGPRTLHAQVRAQTVTPSTPADVRDWDNTAGRLLRSGELRVRLQGADTLIPRRTIEQLDQYHRGVRVWGGGLSRQLDDSSAVSVFGVIYAGIAIDPTPTLTESDAVAAIERIAGARFPRDRRLELAVLPIDEGFRLAWVGELMTRRDVVRYFVDAGDGQLLRHYGMLQRQVANASIGHGTGVLGDDKKVSATSSGGAFLASDPLRPPSIVTYDMRGNTDRAVNILNDVIPLSTADIASSTSNNWTDAAVVDAHTYSAYTYDYYFKRFGRRGLDNADHPLRNMVHSAKRSDLFEPGPIFGDLFFNAFYCGDCAGGIMVYGEGIPGGTYLPSGQFLDYFSGALDVVAHELTHGVTNYSSQPGIRQRVRSAQRGLLGHDGHERRVLLSASRHGPAEGRLPHRGRHRPGPRCPARSMESGRCPIRRSSTNPITTASGRCCRPTRTTTTAACTPIQVFRTTRSTSRSKGARTARPAFACRASAPPIEIRSRKCSTAASRS